MKLRFMSIALLSALALQALGLSGCASYYEDSVKDPTAPPMPQRPEPGPVPETGVGIIAGDVRVEALGASVLVTFEAVGLFQNGKLLATSTTDGHGHFRFAKAGDRQLYDDGVYELTLLSDRYRGSSRIQYARSAKRMYQLSAERKIP